MSLRYFSMLMQRKSDKGQPMTIAVCKCVGMLTPTIYETIEGNWFILVTGVICFAFIMVCHDAQIPESMADEIYSIYEGKVKKKDNSAS